MSNYLAAALLAVILSALAWQTARDRRDYAAFRALVDTAGRQAFYRRWSTMSFVMMGLGGIAILALLGRIEALVHFPAEFASLRPDLPQSSERNISSPDFLFGMLIGGVIGLVALFFIWRTRIRKMRQPVIGDIEPLLPRNYAEVTVAAPLAISAGVCEELFFRLALPLLAFVATGSAIAAFVIAGLTFGLMHWYQGPKGVVMVTLMGGFFAWLYLSSGSLLKPMIVHTVVDLMALVIRPAISLHLARRTESRAAVPPISA